MRGVTAESRVVPLRKKSDIREERGQSGTWNCPSKMTRINRARWRHLWRRGVRDREDKERQ